MKRNPVEIVTTLGLRNGYLLAFFSALFGGLTLMTAVFVYPTVVTLGLGGLNSFLLGFLAATGLSLANIFFYYFGAKGREVVQTSKSFTRLSTTIVRWLDRMPDFVIPIFVIFYVGLTPLPNNLLTTSCGLIDYHFKKLIIPLYIGNILLMTILASVPTVFLWV